MLPTKDLAFLSTKSTASSMMQADQEEQKKHHHQLLHNLQIQHQQQKKSSNNNNNSESAAVAATINNDDSSNNKNSSKQSNNKNKQSKNVAIEEGKKGKRQEEEEEEEEEPRNMNHLVQRGFSPDPPMPWSCFSKLRKSSTSTSPKLTPPQESNVLKAISKVSEGSAGSIHDAVPVVSALIDKVCPELRVGASGGNAGGADAASSQQQQQESSTSSTAAAATREGTTFTLLAVVTGHLDLLRVCLSLGANPNDERFLMDASKPNGIGSTMILQPSLPVSSSSSLSPTSQTTTAYFHYMRNGYTPFFVACICEQVECMEELHKHGASLHTFDRWGRTPLHAAAALGNKGVVEWLLAHGAPRLVSDRDCFRPGELCVSKQTIPPRDSQFPNILLRSPSSSSLCACGSGRNVGSCGCVDDMYEKWYSDRAQTRWLPSEITNAISEAQSSVLASSFPNFIASVTSSN